MKAKTHQHKLLMVKTHPLKIYYSLNTSKVTIAKTSAFKLPVVRVSTFQDLVGVVAVVVDPVDVVLAGGVGSTALRDVDVGVAPAVLDEVEDVA